MVDVRVRCCVFSAAARVPLFPDVYSTSPSPRLALAIAKVLCLSPQVLFRELASLSPTLVSAPATALR